MKFHINIDIADASTADITRLNAALGALGGSEPVVSPEPAPVAEEPKPAAPAKRGPGRPRMTDEEKAEAKAKRDAIKAQERERAAAEKAAAKAAKQAREDAVKDAEAAASADFTPEEPTPTPTEEPTEEEPPLDTAVSRATALLADGNMDAVKDALEKAGAKRVSELKGDAIGVFLAALPAED